MKVQTIADYERSRPNYLEVQYPREVAGWGKFSRKIQELEKQRQRAYLIQEGYTENEDGSFTK